MNIREMTDKDIPAVLSVDRKSFKKAWSEKMLCEELEKDYSAYYVAEDDDGLVGYIGIWCIYETAELMRVAVLPEARGRGIGLNLVSKAMDVALAQGCERMMLEVRKSNFSAQSVYLKCGFKEINIRKGYYDGEDAIIMEAMIG